MGIFEKLFGPKLTFYQRMSIKEKNKEINLAFFNCSFLVSHSDEKIDKNETELLEKIATNFDISKQDLIDFKSRCDSNPGHFDEILSSLNPWQRQSLLKQLVGMAIIDGNFEEEELNIIKSFLPRLNMSENKLDLIIEEMTAEFNEKFNEKTKKPKKDNPKDDSENSNTIKTFISSTKTHYNNKQIADGIPLIENMFFKKLKGISFNKIKVPPPNANSEDFFNFDVDGSWYFTIMNFAMIFKSFSQEKFNEELLNLLDANNIHFDSITKTDQFDFWEGEGFKIETPKMPNMNLIVISNEDYTNTEVTKLRKTDKASIVNVDWIDGIDYLYDGEEALKKTKGESFFDNFTSVPLHFKDEDGDFYILIPTGALNVAIVFIDDLIEKNGGKINFKFIKERGIWQNIYQTKTFTIGYMSNHKCIRINKHPLNH